MPDHLVKKRGKSKQNASTSNGGGCGKRYKLVINNLRVENQ